jgi:gamma-glutamyltranspeptidase
MRFFTAHPLGASDRNPADRSAHTVGARVADVVAMGHQCEVASGYQRKIAGKGQVIQLVQDPSGRRVWACGSDLRGDGCAVGQI